MAEYDADAYRAAELAGYEAVATDYDRWLASVTERFADPLLELLAPAPGERILDAACGPGVVALRLLPRVRPGGSVAGVDFSTQMAQLAREKAGGAGDIEFSVMDVERLQFPGASFDAAACGFGLMHFPDPDAALRELARVLKPGGRLALSVWAPLPRVEFMAVMLDAVKAVAPDAGFPPGPPMFGYGEPAALRPRFEAAGLAPAAFREAELELAFPSFEAWWNALVLGAARLGGIVRALPENRRAALDRRLRETLAPRTGPGGLRLRGAALLALAVRPVR